MMWKNAVTNDAEAASAEEGRLILSAAEVLRELGFKIRDISAGSTPTGRGVAQTGLVNEIRPGTYIFYDWMTRLEGACSEEEIAAFVAATVVSTPSPGLAVIDAGVKTFSADVRLNEPPFALPGFAKVAGRDDLILDRLNEEHGMLWVSSENSKTGETGLRVGDVLRLIPGHICTAVNLQDKIYALEGGGLSEIPVDARGKVR
jgi:D-serine deaminase-like pyridoxal phosphate-dependent protein